jgi:hypothetical protein
MVKAVQLLLLAVTLSSLQAAAQTVSDEAEAEPGPVYQVEVLVFRHVDQSRNTAEISRLIEDVLDEQLARLTAADPALTASADVAANRPFWELANRDQRVMRNDAERLQRLPAYDLIGHFAWIQAADDITVAREVATIDLDPAADVSGTFKLYRKRYLHLAVDLMLGANAKGRQRGDSGNGGFNQLLPVKQANPAIVDSRRMRLERVVYFDQPEFGVLAIVKQLGFNESEWSPTAGQRSAELSGG